MRLKEVRVSGRRPVSIGMQPDVRGMVMSIASSAGPARHPATERVADVYLWGVSAIWIPVLAWQVAADSRSVFENPLELAAWTVLLAVVNLLPVSGWHETSIAADLPIAAAGALILSPAAIGLAAFVGAFDPKEIQGRISPQKALFNRSQVSLTDFAASLIGHSVLVAPASSPLVLPMEYLVLATIVIANLALIAPAVSLDRRIPLAQALRPHPGTRVDQVLTFLAWGALGAMLVALYDQIQSWALLAFLAPTLLGRQMLARSQTFLDAARAYKSAERALIEMSKRIQEERTDERRLIAADLHDEVLQPLFKVSLMAEVLKSDLATGRLLEADEDLPELVSAAEVASQTLRDLIGDLRRSTLGRGGLGPALESLLRSLRKHSTARIHSNIERVQVGPSEELAIYQVAKEGIINALTHSKATNVWVSLTQGHGRVGLSVRDDGTGFDPESAREGHYGIYIMKERAASVGARLFFDSNLGQGSDLILDLECSP